MASPWGSWWDTGDAMPGQAGQSGLSPGHRAAAGRGGRRRNAWFGGGSGSLVPGAGAPCPTSRGMASPVSRFGGHGVAGLAARAGARLEDGEVERPVRPAAPRPRPAGEADTPSLRCAGSSGRNPRTTWRAKAPARGRRIGSRPRGGNPTPRVAPAAPSGRLRRSGSATASPADRTRRRASRARRPRRRRSPARARPPGTRRRRSGWGRRAAGRSSAARRRCGR